MWNLRNFYRATKKIVIKKAENNCGFYFCLKIYKKQAIAEQFVEQLSSGALKY